MRGPWWSLGAGRGWGDDYIGFVPVAAVIPWVIKADPVISAATDAAGSISAFTGAECAEKKKGEGEKLQRRLDLLERTIRR